MPEPSLARFDVALFASRGPKNCSFLESIATLPGVFPTPKGVAQRSPGSRSAPWESEGQGATPGSMWNAFGVQTFSLKGRHNGCCATATQGALRDPGL